MHGFGVTELTFASLTGVLTDAHRIATECFCPTPTDYLPILANIQPAALCRQKTISLAYRRLIDPKYLLYQPSVNGRSHICTTITFSPFVPAASKLLSELI